MRLKEKLLRKAEKERKIKEKHKLIESGKKLKLKDESSGLVVQIDSELPMIDVSDINKTFDLISYKKDWSNYEIPESYRKDQFELENKNIVLTYEYLKSSILSEDLMSISNWKIKYKSVVKILHRIFMI